MDFSTRALLRLAWPIILARMSQVVVGLCDAAMTAPLGRDALAATTAGSINVFTIVIFPMGIVLIAQSFSSQYSGKGDMRTATRFAWYGLIVAAASEILALICYPAVAPAVSLFHYEAGVRELMTPYLQYRLLGVGAIVGVEALGNWYGGTGDTRTHMRASLCGMVLNVFLNWVFIYGNWGMPALGVEGAAIASTLASVGAFLYIATRFALDRKVPSNPRRLGLKRSEFQRYIRFGLPNGVIWFLEFAAISLFINVVVADLGTSTLAAMMVVFNINSVSFMPGFGLASAGAILAGQAIGSGNSDLVPTILRRTTTAAIVWEGAVGICYVLFPSFLLSLFAPNDESSGEFLSIGVVLLMMSAAWQVFDAIGMTTGEVLRAAGDTAWAMYARIAVAWLWFAPLSFVFVRILGGDHVVAMLTLIAFLAMLALVLQIRFRSGKWRKIDITSDS